MKKVLFFSQAMEIGGAESALLGLLETIDTNKYKVDLFLMRHSGELIKFIPKDINLLPEIPQYAAISTSIKAALLNRQFRVVIRRLKGKRLSKKRARQLGYNTTIGIAIDYSHKYTCPIMPMISAEEYDVAISFLAPHYFVASKANAARKIAWIHTDYSTLEIDVESELKMWEPFESIVSISDKVTDSFLKIYPSLKSRVAMISNIIPAKYMNERVNSFNASEEINDGESIILLSIGRFCEAKNFDNVPFICKKIIELGIKVKWYLIGFGIDEELICQKIIEAQMEEYVIVLGKKVNPYPYIKACDIYLQPSRYEGKCVSVVEAQILNKPVIITNYKTSGSQLKDGYDGIIVPMDNEGCAEGIVSVLKDKNLQKRLIENTKKCDYVNKDEIEKLYYLMES